MTWHHLKQTLSLTMTASLLVVSLAAVLALTQGAKFLSVQSGSMVPVYHRGDLVIAHNVAGGNYKPGDVITFINPNNAKQTITHRIARIVPADAMHAQRFQTKGDANLAADVPIYKQAIIGKVGYSIPHLGTVFDFARQPIGLLLLIYVPAMLVVASEMRRLIEHYKRQEPYVASGFTPDSEERKRLSASDIKTVVKVGAVTTIAVTGIVIPTVHAAFLSTAILGGNTITSTPTQTLNHLVLSKVVFGTTSSNTSATNTTNVTVVTNNPQNASSGNVNVSGGGSATSGNASNSSNISTTITITGGSGSNTTSTTPATVTIYNPTSQPIAIAGWKLVDDSTTQTLPANVSIGARASYTFAWPVTNGLSRISDRLVLREPTGAAVDAISWGSDTTQLNPAIATTATTISLNRTPNLDTDKASDWIILP